MLELALAGCREKGYVNSSRWLQRNKRERKCGMFQNG